MFRKLHARLLSINMLLITLLLLVAFGVFYGLTYNRTYDDIERDLRKAESFKPDHPKDILTKTHEDSMKSGLPRREPIFAINLTYDSDIISVDAFFEEDMIFYSKILSKVQQTSKKIITIEDKKWAYEYVPRKDYYQIIFLDVTPRLNMLRSMIYTFVTVIVMMLVMSLIVSSYLTNTALQPIQRAFEKQKQFISDASHEIKTPLAVINANIEYMLSDPKKDKDGLNYVKHEVDRMSKLTDDLLYLSQFDKKESLLEYQEVNLSEITENIILSMETLFFERKKTLSHKISPDIFVQGDPNSLEQLILILLDNAMKYSEKDIVVMLTQERNHCHFSIQNDGKIIPEEHIDNLFDRFYKVDSSRSQTTGYGLGLSIAKAIIDSHKGKIECVSNADSGTIISFHLMNQHHNNLM